MALPVVANADEVTQLIGQATGLISRIIRAAEMAHQNRLECEHLAHRLCTINGLLPCLRQELLAAPPLKELNNTLQEAHDMVVTSRNRSAARQFFRSRRHADCFNQVNARIASDVGILNICLNSITALRYSKQVLHPNHTGVPTATIATAPSLGSSSGSLQTQVVV